MNTKNILLLALLSLLSFTLAACSDDDGDTTKPIINVLEPEEDAALLIGDEHGVHFEADFSDDVALKSYKIEIHDAMNGHTHGAAKLKESTVNFAFNKTYELGGLRNAHIHHHDIIIPENATPGHYHLMVYVTDVAGNQSYIARDIELSHDATAHEE